MAGPLGVIGLYIPVRPLKFCENITYRFQGTDGDCLNTHIFQAVIDKFDKLKTNSIMNKKTLSILFWIGIIFYIGYSCQSSASGSMEISPEEFLQTKESGNSVILDVRTSREFETGHLPGAILIDIYSPGAEEKLMELDPSKTYYVYCHSGARSRSVVFLLHKQGFTKSYNISGGMINLKRAGATITK